MDIDRRTPPLPPDEPLWGVPEPLRIPETLTPIERPPNMDALRIEDSLGTRIRAIWETVETYIEKAVGSAEVLFGDGTGEQKKEFVTERGIELLRELEGKYDLLPGIVEGLVFKALELALDFIIERAVKQLPGAAPAT